jgi:hypothetical protein
MLDAYIIDAIRGEREKRESDRPRLRIEVPVSRREVPDRRHEMPDRRRDGTAEPGGTIEIPMLPGDEETIEDDAA